MRKKLGPVIAGTLLIIVIILILVVGKRIEKYIPSEEKQDLQEYFHINDQKDIALIWNHEFSQIKARYLDGVVYLNYSVLTEKLNSCFYWDENENLLRYTTAEDLITSYAGKKEYFIGNDIVKESYEIVKLEDGDVYVALDFIQKYTDLAYQLYQEPNRMLLTTDWEDTYGVASVKKDTQLRVKGGIKSPILTELQKGVQLTVLETMDEWSKVETDDGLIGYVKNKKLSFSENAMAELPPHSYAGEVFTHRLMDQDVNLLWHQVTNQEANSRIATVLANSKNVNVICPTWFYLNDDHGNLADLGNKDYVAYCHEQGVKVWGLFSNLENQDVNSTYVLSHSSIRENLVNQIISMALNYNLDGVNIDFEALQKEAGAGYVQFIRELSLKCDDNNLVLSVDNYVPTEYTRFYNRQEQANFADYIIVMAYDEHYYGSDEGSVSSIGFVQDGAKNTITSGVPAEQVILGLPFYTRIWAEIPKDENGDSVEAASDDYVGYDLTSEAVSMAEARKRVDANGAEIVWQDDVGQYYAEYENSGVIYKVWLEDARSLDLKLQVKKEQQLGGVAFWKAGMETTDVWDTIVKYVN